MFCKEDQTAKLKEHARYRELHPNMNYDESRHQKLILENTNLIANFHGLTGKYEATKAENVRLLNNKKIIDTKPKDGLSDDVDELSILRKENERIDKSILGFRRMH